MPQVSDCTVSVSEGISSRKIDVRGFGRMLVLGHTTGSQSQHRELLARISQVLLSDGQQSRVLECCISISTTCCPSFSYVCIRKDRLRKLTLYREGLYVRRRKLWVSDVVGWMLTLMQSACAGSPKHGAADLGVESVLNRLKNSGWLVVLQYLGYRRCT
jgi:hypothetical protein